MELHVRGTALPGREPIELWTDHGRISRSPVAGARKIAAAGFVLPGLVDVHTHPGPAEPGQPLDDAVLHADLLAHRDAGVMAVRVLGAPSGVPGWAHEDLELPRVISSGPWLSTPGLFFSRWGREVSEAELPDAADGEATAGDGWVKLRGDCTDGTPERTGSTESTRWRRCLVHDSFHGVLGRFTLARHRQ